MLGNSEIRMAVQGERVAGGFILIAGIDGTRYAVRQQAVTVIHDADECRDETVFTAPRRSCRARTVLA